MKKIVIAAMLSAFVAAPAVAADTAGNIGFNYSVDNAFGFHGEFDISSMTNKTPVSVQVFLKNYTQYIAPGISWSTTGIGVAGIFDFHSMAKLGKKIHPYAGMGLISVSHKWRGAGPAWTYSGVGGGLYFTGGVRYALTPQTAADFNYNNFGSLTAGINFSF
ncbi:MAG: hypothetical protein A2V79_09795 [Betaproteobacteria bacterium RBG_16_56_24]|nr:MAG: hypothetical protein A2V79_09795 [Betaproteobacteria bacterium RBG_16_56_24]